MAVTSTGVKPCPHCHRKRRLSPKTATVAVFGDSSRFRRQIGDYSRQCGQALIGQRWRSKRQPRGLMRVHDRANYNVAMLPWVAFQLHDKCLIVR